MASYTSRRRDSCVYYWDTVLYAMEYELASISTSFPLTEARVDQFCDVISKVPGASPADFKYLIQGTESSTQVGKWEAVVSYMKKNPRVVTPLWNHLTSQMKQGSSTKDIKDLHEKLNGACVKFNKIKTGEMSHSDIIEDVEQMAKQISAILEQDNISRKNVESVNEELNKFNTLDCRFQRLSDFYEKEIREMRKEIDVAAKRSDERMTKINEQLKKHIEAKEKLDQKYQKAEKKIEDLAAKTSMLDSNQFEDKTGKDTLSKFFQHQKQTMLDLRNDNVKLRAEVEHLNLTTNQVLTENLHLSEAMAEMKKDNVHVRAQLDCVTARLDNLSGTLSDKLDEIIKNTKKE